MTPEELRSRGFDCFCFTTLEALDDFRTRRGPTVETEVATLTLHGFTVHFLGVKTLKGKAAAQAALEAECG